MNSTQYHLSQSLRYPKLQLLVNRRRPGRHPTSCHYSTTNPAILVRSHRSVSQRFPHPSQPPRHLRRHHSIRYKQIGSLHMHRNLRGNPRNMSSKFHNKLRNYMPRRDNILLPSLLSMQCTSILLRWDTLVATRQLVLIVVVTAQALQCHRRRCIPSHLVNRWLHSLPPFAVSHLSASQHMGFPVDIHAQLPRSRLCG